MVICYIDLLHFPNNTQRKTDKTIIKQKTKYTIAIIFLNLIELQNFYRHTEETVTRIIDRPTLLLFRILRTRSQF